MVTRLSDRENWSSGEKLIYKANKNLEIIMKLLLHFDIISENNWS